MKTPSHPSVKGKIYPICCSICKTVDVKHHLSICEVCGKYTSKTRLCICNEPMKIDEIINEMYTEHGHISSNETVDIYICKNETCSQYAIVKLFY